MNALCAFLSVVNIKKLAFHGFYVFSHITACIWTFYGVQKHPFDLSVVSFYSVIRDIESLLFTDISKHLTCGLWQIFRNVCWMRAWVITHLVFHSLPFLCVILKTPFLTWYYTDSSIFHSKCLVFSSSPANSSLHPVWLCEKEMNGLPSSLWFLLDSTQTSLPLGLWVFCLHLKMVFNTSQGCWSCSHELWCTSSYEPGCHGLWWCGHCLPTSS